MERKGLSVGIAFLSLLVPACNSAPAPGAATGALDAPLFVDDFGGSTLGPNWIVARGAFTVAGGAAEGTQPQSYAVWVGSPPADAPVSITLGPPTSGTWAGVLARANPSLPDEDHYAAYLDPNGVVGLARRNAYGYTYLGTGPQVGGGTHTLQLTAAGNNPVALTVTLDGAVVIRASDGSPRALASGRAGMFDFDGAARPLDHFVVGAVAGATDGGVPDLASPADLATAPPDLASAPRDLASAPRDLATAPADLATGGGGGALDDIVAIARIGAGDALSTPAQRHMVRIDRGGGNVTYLVAIQQAMSLGLNLFRSDDEGRTWSFFAPLQPNAGHRDTADMIVVGNDIALVYSFEGPFLSGSTQSDVWFQWWRYGNGTWTPQPAVRVFDSTSSATAYYRAELQRDSLGRLWVQAFRLESNGTHTLAIAVSSDGGASFAQEPPLDSLPSEGGGRLVELGSRMLMVYGEFGVYPAFHTTRSDSAPLGQWAPIVTSLPEGIYHGSALSSVADGAGGLHLVYKMHDGETLLYRHFDGTSFGPSQVVQANGDWALQPAITLAGNQLFIFYNRPLGVDDYELRVRALQSGALGPSTLLDSTLGFKGYLASPERAPAGFSALLCAYGLTVGGNPGNAMLVRYHP